MEKFVSDSIDYLYLIYPKGLLNLFGPHQGRYLIVFNGEIYNHLELRKKLGDFGRNINSHGDTVSLSYFIDEWGIFKSIELLDGMFAIGIWDRKAKCLSLARILQVLNHYFTELNNNGFVFASLYNQISNHPFFKDEGINQSVLKLYIAQHFIHLHLVY